jgi:hypothetical protein
VGFNGDSKPEAKVKLNQPSGVAMASSRGGGKIYIADKDNNRVRILTFGLLKELHQTPQLSPATNLSSFMQSPFSFSTA